MLLNICEHETLEVWPAPKTPAGNVRVNVLAGDKCTQVVWGDTITIKFTECSQDEEG